MISLEQWTDSEMLSLLISGLDSYDKEDLIRIIENMDKRLDASMTDADIATDELDEALLKVNKAERNLDDMKDNVELLKNNCTPLLENSDSRLEEQFYSGISRIENDIENLIE